MNAELVPSVSVDAVVMRRNAAVEKLRAAQAALVDANKLMDVTFADPADHYQLYHVTLNDRSDSNKRFGGDALVDIEWQVKEIDAYHWDWLMKKSGMFTFMDAEAKEKWNKSIRDRDVIELTAATLAVAWPERRPL